MKTRITTRVIIYKDDKILLSRNKGRDYWYPGGGGLEDDENLIECAKREVQEETGQIVEIKDLMYVQEFYFSKNERSLGMFYLAYPTPESKDDFHHKDTDTSGNLTIEENRWFSEEDMKKIKVYPLFIRKNFWQDIKRKDGNYKKFFIEKRETR